MPDSYPPYAASLLIEVWHNKKKKDHFVTIIYEGREVFLKDCKHQRCTIKQFEALLQETMISDLKKKCNNNAEIIPC